MADEIWQLYKCQRDERQVPVRDFDTLCEAAQCFADIERLSLKTRVSLDLAPIAVDVEYNFCSD